MAAAAASSDLTLTLLYMALIVGVFYFLWFRPQQTQRKKSREMLEALSPGDRILTAGGIIGVLRGFEGEIADVEVAPGVVVRVIKRAIIEHMPDATDTTPADE